MKTMKYLLAIGFIAAGLFTAQAQTNNTAGPVQTNLIASISSNPTISGGLQEIYDAALSGTNSGLTFGGGRATTGDYNLVFLDYLYNFNPYVGAVLGFDDIGRGLNFNSENIVFVKGGLNLQTQIAPLKMFGLTNFMATPFTSLLVTSGNGRVGEAYIAGADFNIPISATWNFKIGGFYEKRSGDGLDTDRAYLCIDLAISHGF